MGAEDRLSREDVDAIYTYLDNIGCRPVPKDHYFSCLCPHPDHEDHSPSCQVYYDDGFVHCYSCGLSNGERMHINQIAKLRGDPPVVKSKYNYKRENQEVTEEKRERKTKELPIGDFTSMWLDLPPLPNDFSLKGVPALELNKRGWRAVPANGKEFGGIFIPYFDAKRENVHYYQIRYLEGETRFTVSPGVRQIAYGLETVCKCQKYLCFTEGSRDSVILGMAGIPAVAMINSKSQKLLAGLVDYAKQHNLKVVAICDNDEAGDKLLDNLPHYVLDYRVSRLYGKDVGDFYEKKGLDAVRAYYQKFVVE